MSTGATRLSGTALGVMEINTYNIFIVTTTGAATATLPNGYEGQRVYILLTTDGGDLVVTGDFETGTTATFGDAKDALQLMYIATHGWMTISNQGTVVFA